MTLLSTGLRRWLAEPFGRPPMGLLWDLLLGDLAGRGCGAAWAPDEGAARTSTRWREGLRDQDLEIGPPRRASARLART